ncbi:MAG: LacI family DNA-binding transcriptional regulator [Rhodobacter sp.]|nr:LacI family DNA-binding transcriptional regulator [Rhodobacter sp.]
MANRPTPADVAREAGLSEATVDRALNGRGNVSDRAVQKVAQAARKLESTAEARTDLDVRGSIRFSPSQAAEGAAVIAATALNHPTIDRTVTELTDAGKTVLPCSTISPVTAGTPLSASTTCASGALPPKPASQARSASSWAAPAGTGTCCATWVSSRSSAKARPSSRFWTRW